MLTSIFQAARAQEKATKADEAMAEAETRLRNAETALAAAKTLHADTLARGQVWENRIITHLH